MTLGRFNIDIWRKPDGSISWNNFGFYKGCCECYFFDLGPIGFTWLSKECK